MRRLLSGIAVLFALGNSALAADGSVPSYTAGGAISDTDVMYCAQAAGTTDRKCTPLQLSTYIFGKFGGDATVSAGTVTLATVNANVGSFGSATACVSLTVNAKGLITAASAATCAPAIGSVTGLGSGVGTLLGTFSSANLLAALTTKTGTGNAVFGTAPTIDSLNATTAMTLAYLAGGGIQCLHVSNTGAVTGTGSDCGSGSGGVTSIAGNTGAFTLNSASGLTNATNDIKCQVSSSSQFGCSKPDGTTLQATAGVLTAVPGVTSRTVTGATDTILSTDRGNVVYYNSASAIAVSQPAPSGAFAANFFTTLCNINAGTPTVTPGSGTIDNGATYPILAGTASSPACISYQSDGTNFNAVDLTPSYGTGVQAALGKALSAAGGLTSTIAKGTAVLGTSAIASGACATVVTVSATNVATTDIVSAGYNSDPTAVTGYGPSATGAVLSVYPYPTANNFNVKVCNSSSGSITPGAMTLNLVAVR